MINHQQMLLSAFNELKAKEYTRFQCICGQDKMTQWKPAVQQHLGMVEFQLEGRISRDLHSHSTWTEPNVVEFFILGPSLARMALSRVARQRMVGSAMTTTTSESRTAKCKETCTGDVRAKRSQLLSSSPESGAPFVVLRTSQDFFGSFWQFRIQTV